MDAAVDTLFWPLYEVVDGNYQLTHRPDHVRPIEEWLGLQKHFPHLLRPDGRPLVEQIQRQVDADWRASVGRCDSQ